MPFDSGGNFSLVPSYLAVTGQVIQPSQHNPVLEDLSASGLSAVLVRDGRAPMTGNLNMGGFKSTNMASGTLTTDGASKGQLGILSTKSANYTAVASDFGAYMRFTATATLSLTAATTLGVDWRLNITANGGDVTIDPNASETINGLATLIVPNGTTAQIICDGANFFTVIRPSARQTIRTQTFTAVSAVDFTDLSPFRELWIHGVIAFSAVSDLGWRSSTNNGSSYDQGASDYSSQILVGQGAAVAAAQQTASTYALMCNGQTSLYLDLHLLEFNQAAGCGAITNVTSFNGGFGTIYVERSGQFRNSLTARNAARIIPIAAVTMTGTLTIEGMIG